MIKDLKWLVDNIQWPSEEVTTVGLDPDGEVRFSHPEYDFYPENPPVRLTKNCVALFGGAEYTKEEFMRAKGEIEND